MDIMGVLASAGSLAATTAAIAGLVPILTRLFLSRSSKRQSELRPIPDAPDEIPPELMAKILDGGTEKLSPGEQETQAILNTYSKELAAEAQRISKRVNAERPSKKHVRLAAERIGVLRDRSGAISDGFLALGSVLAGAGVSFYVNIATGGVAGAGASVWPIGCLVAGTGCAVGGLVVKVRRS